MKRFLLCMFCLATFGWAFGQQPQTVYQFNQYHGSVQAGANLLNLLGPQFELPQVTSTLTATTVTWTAGKIYPDATSTFGINVNAGTSGTLDASKSSCAPPLFSSCDIIIASPVGGITGTITGTFTAGEQVSQATSNAVAYALNGATGTGTLYLSTVVSGTADATHTWTGASSAATLASPSAAPAAPGTALITTSAGVSKLPGIVPLAYVTTNASNNPVTITYPYQITGPFGFYGQGAPSILVGFCAGTVTSAGTDYAFPLGGSTATCSSNTTATVGVPSPSPGVLYNLAVKDGTAPGGTLTGVWTVLVNGTASPITCTITGTATTCSDTVHYAVVKAGDLVTIKDVTGTTSAEASPTVTLEKY